MNVVVYLFSDPALPANGILPVARVAEHQIERTSSPKLYIWWPVPLFLDNYFIYRYNMEVDEEKLGLIVVLLARCGQAAWMHWSWIDVIVLGFKSIEELYPSSPLRVDSADTSQLHAQGKEFAWTIPVLPNNPARQ
jgi:hypothetical protein